MKVEIRKYGDGDIQVFYPSDPRPESNLFLQVVLDMPDNLERGSPEIREAVDLAQKWLSGLSDGFLRPCFPRDSN